MTLELSTKNSKNWNFIALGLVLSLVGVLFFWEKLSADDDLKKSMQENVRKSSPLGSCDRRQSSRGRES